MKRLLSVSFAAMLLLALFAQSASAGWFWCEDDPLVNIVTPAGNVVPVHVTNYGGGDNLSADQMKKINAAVKEAKISYEVDRIESRRDGDESDRREGEDRGRRDGHDSQGTRVEITVRIPSIDNNKRFDTRAVVSSLEFGAGIVYDTVNGRSGQSMKLRFDLNVP